MPDTLSVLLSMSVVVIYWLFIALIADATLIRKYSLLKTISLWLSGLVISLLADALLLEINFMLQSFVPASEYYLVEFTINTLVVIVLAIFIIICSVLIYSGTKSSKIFLSSFYAILGLYCYDVALTIVKLIMPVEEHFGSLYFLQQGLILLISLVVIRIVIVPRLSKRIDEIYRQIKGDFTQFIKIPIIVYIAYLIVCCVSNLQIVDSFNIPLVITRLVLMIFSVIMYFVVISSISSTAKIMEIDNELNISRIITSESLPTDEDLDEIPNTDISAFIKSYYWVGGDYYNVFRIDENNSGIIIADVSGKGIPAAMFMMRAATIITSYLKTLKDPAKALTHANEDIMWKNDSCMFVTVFLGILSSDGKLVYSNAGHVPQYVCSNGSVKPLPCKKTTVIGIRPQKYENEEITMSDNEVLFLYTDGVPDAVNLETKTFYGRDRIESIIKNQTEPKSMISSVYEDLEKFTECGNYTDDITMLAVKYKKD